MTPVHIPAAAPKIIAAKRAESGWKPLTHHCCDAPPNVNFRRGDVVNGFHRSLLFLLR